MTLSRHNLHLTNAIAYFSNTVQNGFYKDWGVHHYGLVENAHVMMCLPNESVFMVPHFEYARDVY